MTDLLSAKQVREEFGYSRSTLLRWEGQGDISPQRTPGGHRRYSREQIKNIDLIQDDSQNIATPTTDEERALQYTEYGATGLREWNGSIREERLEELRGRSGRILKREMRVNDPVIAATFFGISNAMRQASWRVKAASEKPEDKRARDYVEQCLHDMSWSWTTQLAFIVEEMLEQGFSTLEVVFKRRLGQDPPAYVESPAKSNYTDGRVGWRKWSPRPAESLAPGQEWMLDETGGVQGIRQQPITMMGSKKGLVEIPIEKMLHFRTTPHPANNPEGREIHRGMYTSWWFKSNLQELEGIGIERDLAGIPVVYLGRGTSKKGPNSDYEMAKDLVVNLRNDEQAGIVFPHQKLDKSGEGILLDLLSTGSRRQYNTSEIINRYNKVMAMSVLSQFLFLGMERVGSYALVKYQGDLFSLAVGAWLDGIADVINRHGITKLLRYNTFNVTEYPKLVHGTVGISDLEGLAKFVNSMVSAKVIEPDAELERSLRQAANLPQRAINLDENDSGERSENVEEEENEENMGDNESDSENEEEEREETRTEETDN